MSKDNPRAALLHRVCKKIKGKSGQERSYIIEREVASLSEKELNECQRHLSKAWRRQLAVYRIEGKRKILARYVTVSVR